MERTEQLLVTAKYGSLEFHETACPYNKNAHEEQGETCIESIRQQIRDAGKAEMTDAFAVTEKVMKA